MASVWRYSLHAILIGWTLLQLTIPLIRYDAAVANLKYFNNYPPIQDPQVTQIFPILNYIKQNDVDVMVSDFDLYPSDVVDAWTIMLSDQVQLVPFYSPRYSGQQWWSQLDQVPSFWIVTPNRDYFEASDIGTRVVGESGSLSLYAITPDDIDRLLNNADLLNPAIPEPMITNMSFLSVLAENDTVRSFMGSAIVRFLATGEQNAGFYIEYTPDHEGELPLSLNGEIIEQKTLQANRQDTVYLCSQPKPGINTLAFEVQGGQASVKVSALQLSLSSLPASIDIGTGTDVAFLEDGWYAPDTLGGGLNLRWAKLEASLRIVRNICGAQTPPQSYTLSFNAFQFLPEQEVDVIVNGESVGEISLEDDGLIHTYSITFPASVVGDAAVINIDLKHEDTLDLEADARRMAVAYDWFSLESK